MARKSSLQEFKIGNGLTFLSGKYKPRQRLEKLIAAGMSHLSTYSYFPEVVVGEKITGRSFRVDGIIPEREELVSIRSQTVSGSTDDKLLTEIQCLQDACDMHGWKRAIVVIDDPNDKMNWGKAFLSKNKFSRCYARNQERYPNVEIIEFADFASRYYNRAYA